MSRLTTPALFGPLSFGSDPVSFLVSLNGECSQVRPEVAPWCITCRCLTRKWSLGLMMRQESVTSGEVIKQEIKLGAILLASTREAGA